MIGYYVHHQGHGHLNRALAVASRLPESVVFLSSLPRPDGLRPGDDWVSLPMDVPATDQEPVDPTANGVLHWVPRHVDGLARRTAIITDVLAARRPRRMVVDVSVEIVLLARLCGIPVTVMAMPGDRTDRAHTLAYDVADQIIAPWAAEVYRPPWLAARERTAHYVGCISRFEGRARPGKPTSPRALLLGGAGGNDDPADAVDELRSAAGRFEWTAVGGRAAWVDDPWPLIASADLVVCHAGQNSVADVALAGPAAVVVAQRRPFGEQAESARSLAEAGIGVVVSGWPERRQWPSILSHAMASDRSRWRALRADGAAARAAAVIAS